MKKSGTFGVLALILLALTLSQNGIATLASRQSPEDGFLSAQKAYNNGNTSLARRTIFSSLSRQSQSYLTPEYLLLLSVVYLNENDPDQAEVILRGLSSLNPLYAEDPTALLIKSAVFMERKNDEKALSTLIPVETDAARYQKAYLLEKSNQSFAAVSQLTAVNLDKGFYSGPARAALANAYLSLTEFDKAGEVASFSGAEKKLRAPQAYVKAVAAYQNEEYAKALLSLSRFPPGRKKWTAYKNLLKGLTLQQLGRTEEAKAAFNLNLKTRESFCQFRSAVELIGIYVGEDNPAAANKVCQTVIAHAPSKNGRLPFLLLRGLTYARTHQPNLAVKDFELVSQSLHPEWGPKGLFFLGQGLTEAGEYKNMTTAYYQNLKNMTKKAAKKNPEAMAFELGWSAFLVGNSFTVMKNYTEAEKMFRDVLSRSPAPDLTAQTVSGLVGVLIKQGKYKKAEAELDRLVVRFGEDREVTRYTLLARAHLKWNAKKYEEAAGDYADYIRLFEDSGNIPFAYYQWGRALQMNEEPEKALAAWSDLRRKSPASPFAVKSLIRSAVLEKDRGNTAESEALFAQLAKEGDSEAARLAYLQMGSMALKSQDTEKAIRVFDAFLNKYPDTASYHSAVAYIKDGYAALAASDPGRLPVLFEEYKESFTAGEALYYMAKDAMNQGKIEKALDMLNQILADYPRTPSASEIFYHKGQAEYILGRPKKAIVSLNQFIKQNPQDDLVYEARYYLGRAMLKAQNPREAILAFNTLIEMDPGSYYSGSALIRKAEAYRLISDTPNEKKTYEKFLSDFGHRPESNRARLELASLQKRDGEFEPALENISAVQPEEGLITEEDLTKIKRNLETLLIGKEVTK